MHDRCAILDPNRASRLRHPRAHVWSPSTSGATSHPGPPVEHPLSSKEQGASAIAASAEWILDRGTSKVLPRSLEPVEAQTSCQIRTHPVSIESAEVDRVQRPGVSEEQEENEENRGGTRRSWVCSALWGRAISATTGRVEALLTYLRTQHPEATLRRPLLRSRPDRGAVRPSHRRLALASSPSERGSPAWPNSLVRATGTGTGDGDRHGPPCPLGASSRRRHRPRDGGTRDHGSDARVEEPRTRCFFCRPREPSSAPRSPSWVLRRERDQRGPHACPHNRAQPNWPTTGRMRDPFSRGCDATYGSRCLGRCCLPRRCVLAFHGQPTSRVTPKDVLASA